MSDQVTPSHDELLARARALGPKLAERAAEAEKLRKVPEGTIRELHEAGFFKMIQPSRYGGYECDPGTFFDVQIELASHCPATAWVFGVVAVHSWQLALFPVEAQEEVWSSDRDALISSSYMPVGKVSRVEGGYKLSGRWGFSSGCDHCGWVFLGAFVPPEGDGKAPDMRTFLLPIRDYRIEDSWYVSGLKATGSKDIVVEDVLVPEHRTHRFRDGFIQKSPGHAVNPAPLFKLPFGQIFVRSVSTSAIGMAIGALNAYRDEQAKRVARGDGARVAEDPTNQMVVARAAATIDEIRLVLHRNMADLMDSVRTGREIPIERRVAYRYDSANAVVKCAQVVDDLMTASGGHGIFLHSRINRFFQDVHAARAHYANNPDKPGRNFGGVLLDQRNQDFFI